MKNYPKSGLTSVARIVSRVRCVSSANTPETLTPSAVVLTRSFRLRNLGVGRLVRLDK
nr:MAG TPA: hypothetical protein [Caudoviricetes sp.]